VLSICPSCHDPPAMMGRFGKCSLYAQCECVVCPAITCKAVPWLGSICHGIARAAIRFTGRDRGRGALGGAEGFHTSIASGHRFRNDVTGHVSQGSMHSALGHWPAPCTPRVFLASALDVHPPPVPGKLPSSAFELDLDSLETCTPTCMCMCSGYMCMGWVYAGIMEKNALHVHYVDVCE